MNINIIIINLNIIIIKKVNIIIINIMNNSTNYDYY